MLYGDLNGKEIQNRGDTCICIADSFCSAITQHYKATIMRNAGLEEAQAGIKIAGRKINNLRYADDTTLVAESEEDLKSLLMKVKEERLKSWLKTQHSEN